MKLIDLLSLLVRPGSTLVDLYGADDEENDLCLWTGAADRLPAEQRDRIVESFEPNSYGLNIYLKGAI